MGTLTKAFVVLNLIFAIAFVTVSATVLSHRVNWKDKHYALKAKLEAKEKDLGTAQGRYTRDIQKKNEEIRTEADKVTGLQQQVDAAKKTIDEKNAEIRKQEKNAADANTLAGKLGDTVKTLRQDIQRLDGDLKVARGKRDTAQKEVDRAKETFVALRAQVAAVELNQKGLVLTIDEEKTKVKTYQKYENVVQAMAPTVHDRAKQLAMDVHLSVPERRIHAAVKAVDMKIGVVVLNVGSENKPSPVKEGYMFLIHRKGKLIAAVRVTTVDKNMCATQIVPPDPDEPVQIGDSAMTRF